MIKSSTVRQWSQYNILDVNAYGMCQLESTESWKKNLGIKFYIKYSLYWAEEVENFD